jgi:hypothetical protein
MIKMTFIVLWQVSHAAVTMPPPMPAAWPSSDQTIPLSGAFLV